MSQAIDILALGMASPLGLDSRATIAALRAGFVAHEEVEQVEDLGGEAVVACRLEELDPSASRVERAHFFGTHALVEVLRWRRWTTPPAVFLAIPGPDQSAEFEATRFWGSLHAELDGAPFPPTSTLYPHGRAGLFFALASARDQLYAGVTDLALVGAADSLVTDDELRRLAAGDALLGKRNLDGLVPGEGAAFFLLARHGDRNAFATIESLVLGREVEPRSQGGPPRATALSLVFGHWRPPLRANSVILMRRKSASTLLATPSRGTSQAGRSAQRC